MRELLTGDDLFSEIVMRRTADPRTVIVLEGPSDCVTLDIFLDDTSCYSIDANGKSSVLRVIECSETTSTKRVLGVVDNDAELPARCRAPAKSGLDFLTCGDAAQHAGDGRLLGRHGPGDDHEGSSRHLLITKDHARCHHRPRTPSLTSSTRTSCPTYQKHRRRYWPR